MQIQIRFIAALTSIFLCIAATPGLAAPGDLELLGSDFNLMSVDAVAEQPDGRTIFAGAFDSVRGVRMRNVARLNFDGTLDEDFAPDILGWVHSLAVQPDGKILIAGSFNGFMRNDAGVAIDRLHGVVRVNADGTMDKEFDLNPDDSVFSVLTQADGKILLGGSFTSLRPRRMGPTCSRVGIARVNANGSLDEGFDPKIKGTVFTMAVQDDGKILLGGGDLEVVQPNEGKPATRRSVVRLHSDGRLDEGFNFKAKEIGSAECIAVLADGKIVMAGYFETLHPDERQGATKGRFITKSHNIVRLHRDGTLDTNFDPKLVFESETGTVPFFCTISSQADGKMLIGGFFTAVLGIGAAEATMGQGIVRLNPDGSLDASFNAKSSKYIRGVTLQRTGKALLGIGWDFPRTESRKGFAVLENDAATQVLSVPDATQIIWTRGGAAPEFSRVTFEVSTDEGKTWGNPIPAARIATTSNWKVVGLTLPPTGHLRARGVTTGGIWNASSGLIEQVSTFSLGR